MTQKEFQKVLSLIRKHRKIPTWNLEKRRLIEEITTLLCGGEHEFFISHYAIHGQYVGLYTLNDDSHKRKGHLMKYRGKNIFIFCCGREKGQLRKYLVSTIEGEVKISKSNEVMIERGHQPNTLP